MAKRTKKSKPKSKPAKVAKHLRGMSASVSPPAWSSNPPPFTYTLKYRRDAANTYSLIAPADRWTFTWDGNAGTVDRGVVHPLHYLMNKPGDAEDGESVEFYVLAETDPSETGIRRWGLEVQPRPYISGVTDPVCTVGYFFVEHPNSWEEMGLATKTGRTSGS
jgi:hypothetical protein